MNIVYFEDGTEYLPSKIIGIGRNYSEHIKEMNSSRTDEPVLFVKPNSSRGDITKPLTIPNGEGEVHHELELAVCIGKTGSNIDELAAENYIQGYGLALDLTLRDKQSAAKKAGLPWALAKGFDNSCPVSVFHPKDFFGDVNNLQLRLRVNGAERQNGNTSQMLFKIPELVAYISKYFTLQPGDLILTGTPSGVGPLIDDDLLEAKLGDYISVTTTICQE